MYLGNLWLLSNSKWEKLLICILYTALIIYRSHVNENLNKTNRVKNIKIVFSKISHKINLVVYRGQFQNKKNITCSKGKYWFCKIFIFVIIYYRVVEDLWNKMHFYCSLCKNTWKSFCMRCPWWSFAFTYSFTQDLICFLSVSVRVCIFLKLAKTLSIH